MRVRQKHTMAILSGAVTICDPGLLFPPSDQPPYVTAPAGVPVVGGFGGDGSFKAYRSPDCVIVDTAPRLFKAKSRPEFEPLPGSVEVDSGLLCFLDGDPGHWGVSDDLAVSLGVEPGDYEVWLEENERSVSYRYCLVGFGKRTTLLMAGGNANVIEELERAVAQTRNLKGLERAEAITTLREQILDLHWAGNKDRRLEMLASAIRLELPARRGKRKR